MTLCLERKPKENGPDGENLTLLWKAEEIFLAMSKFLTCIHIIWPKCSCTVSLLTKLVDTNEHNNIHYFSHF